MATNPIRKLPSNKTYATATVTTSTDGLSDVIDLGGHQLSAIQMSTAWTGANMTFMGSVSSTAAMASVYATTAVTELTYATSASVLVAIDPTALKGLRYLQIRSGTAGTPVAQAAARSILLGLNSFEPTRG